MVFKQRTKGLEFDEYMVRLGGQYRVTMNGVETKDMKLLKGFGYYTLVIIACLGVFGIFSLLATLFVQWLFIPDDYIIWTTDTLFLFIIFLVEFITIVTIPPFFAGLRKKNKDTYYEKVPMFVKKHIVFIGVIVLLLLYCAVTNVSVVTNDKIINHRIINPRGTVYSYEDVIGVDTGFYGKRELFQHSKGDFYYFIRLKDGTRIDLNRAGDVNEKTIENYDTYKEIELIDKNLMALGASKISSTDYSDYCYFDKLYKDRFIGIIENKINSFKQ